MKVLVEIYRGQELLVSGELNYVYADTTLRKGVPVPDSWRAAIAAFERTVPVQS
jgi:acyl-CoA thioester hydrolase